MEVYEKLRTCERVPLPERRDVQSLQPVAHFREAVGLHQELVPAGHESRE